MTRRLQGVVVVRRWRWCFFVVVAAAIVVSGKSENENVGVVSLCVLVLFVHPYCRRIQ